MGSGVSSNTCFEEQLNPDNVGTYVKQLGEMCDRDTRESFEYYQEVFLDRMIGGKQIQCLQNENQIISFLEDLGIHRIAHQERLIQGLSALRKKIGLNKASCTHPNLQCWAGMYMCSDCKSSVSLSDERPIYRDACDCYGEGITTYRK